MSLAFRFVDRPVLAGSDWKTKAGQAYSLRSEDFFRTALDSFNQMGNQAFIHFPYGSRNSIPRTSTEHVLIRSTTPSLQMLPGRR
ncbi:MAG: hypothetical protein AAGF81_22630 [Pseudomonadota bacterium]